MGLLVLHTPIPCTGVRLLQSLPFFSEHASVLACRSRLFMCMCMRMYLYLYVYGYLKTHSCIGYAYILEHEAVFKPTIFNT